MKSLEGFPIAPTLVTVGGSLLTYEGLTAGLNLFTAFLGAIAAILAIWWAIIKIQADSYRKQAERARLDKNLLESKKFLE